MVKNIVYIMYQEAMGFLVASRYLKKVIYSNGINLLSCSPAYAVNQTFACELLLKALCKMNQVEYGKNHKLIDILSKLPERLVCEIEKEYELLSKEKRESYDYNVEMRKMDECLGSYDNAFVDWRYYYEKSNEGLYLPWMDFEIVIDILKRNVENHLNIGEWVKFKEN